MIVAGFGFREDASQGSLADALARAEGPEPTALATLSPKAAHPAMRDLAERMNLPLVEIPPANARLETPTQSPAALAAHGVGSVAEASALAALGPGARLVAPRVISSDRKATCAIAIGSSQ